MFYCNFCSKECQGDGKLCSGCEETENKRIMDLYETKIQPLLGTLETTQPILVWEFHKAPEGLRLLSNNGGDEDWLVYVPASCGFEWMPRWIEHLDSCEMPDEFILPNGAKVYIGSHA
jgi:hypothetical protein